MNNILLRTHAEERRKHPLEQTAHAFIPNRFDEAVDRAIESRSSRRGSLATGSLQPDFYLSKD